MLSLKKSAALRAIEDGLKCLPGELVKMPVIELSASDGVFVTVPHIGTEELLGQYLEALAREAWHALRVQGPVWLQLRGPGISGLPVDRVGAIAGAVGVKAAGIGLDLNPRLVGAGDIAGYRSIGVERFHFCVETPYGDLDEPVRRVRALGAFSSVEIVMSDGMPAKRFLESAGNAVEATPNQICLNLSVSRGPAGAEPAEKAGKLFEAAGYQRTGLWAWARDGVGFDTFGMLLSGRCAVLGPSALAIRPSAYENPALGRWLQTRLEGDFEVLLSQGRPEQWVALISGLYAMDLSPEGLEFGMRRRAEELKRIGVVDDAGAPRGAQALEFCHRAAIAARFTVAGDQPGRALEQFDAGAYQASQKG